MQRKVVKVSEGQLKHFRSLARDSDNEIMAYLIGEVIDGDTVEIDSFEYTKDYAISKPNAVSWYVHEYERVRKKAEKRGRRIIGFIHSHPNWDSVMSSEDADHCVTNGLRVCGIVAINDRKTIVRFWVTDSALPCQILEWNAKNPRTPNSSS